MESIVYTTYKGICFRNYRNGWQALFPDYEIIITIPISRHIEHFAMGRKGRYFKHPKEGHTYLRRVFGS